MKCQPVCLLRLVCWRRGGESNSRFGMQRSWPLHSWINLSAFLSQFTNTFKFLFCRKASTLTDVSACLAELWKAPLMLNGMLFLIILIVEVNFSVGQHDFCFTSYLISGILPKSLVSFFLISFDASIITICPVKFIIYCSRWTKCCPEMQTCVGTCWANLMVYPLFCNPCYRWH